MSFEPRLPRDDVNVSPTHPLAEASWLLVAAAVAGLMLAVLAFGATEVVARWLPPGLEARLFGDLFGDVGETAGAGEPPRGGTIAVTRGLLASVESENELAFVLGHELGHFAARDHLRALGRGLILGFVLRAAVGAGAEATVPELASALASRGFARDQERDADAFALHLLAAEYGHVAGADAFFRRLPDAHAGLADRAASWLATHPVSESRIAALHDLAAREHLSPTGPLRGL